LILHGNTDPDAELVILYGNCQVPWIARLLSAVDGSHGQRGYLSVLNHGPAGQALQLPSPRDLARCKLYLEQYDSEIFVRQREEVRDGIPKGCPTVLFPSYVARFLWPFRVAEPSPLCDPLYVFGRYSEGDRVALKVRTSGMRGEAAVDAYIARSSESMPNLDRRFDVDMNFMETRDRICDVAVCDYVRDNFRSQHLFWNFGHISAQGIAELAARVWRAAASDVGGDPATATAKIREAAEVLGGMGPIQQPIHPRVAEHFGLQFHSHDMRYRWFDQRWTFREYMARYIGLDANW
jgi:hypothetical protein